MWKRKHNLLGDNKVKVRFNFPYRQITDDLKVEVPANEVMTVTWVTDEHAIIDGVFKMPIDLFFKITERVDEVKGGASKVKRQQKAVNVSAQRVCDIYNETYQGTYAQLKTVISDDLKGKLDRLTRADFFTEQSWRDLFEAVKQSDFLMGKVQAGDRKPFKLTIEWLVKPANLSKVLDGYYHGE